MSEARLLLKGVVHGRMIELAEEPGLPDGAEVAVLVQPLQAPGDGIRESAGAWGDAGDEFDRWLEEIQRGRQQDRPGLS